MSDLHEWVTAAEAGQVLKMSPRQVHRYGESGKVRTKRAGRLSKTMLPSFGGWRPIR